MLTIDDPTEGWSYQNGPFVLSTPQLTAEWIVEAPSLGSTVTDLTDFGTAGFYNAAAVIDGQDKPLSEIPLTPLEIESQNSDALLALPGPLDDADNGFTDTWYASS
jgi:hypothetical protein